MHSTMFARPVSVMPLSVLAALCGRRRRVGLTSGSITTAIDRLEARKLVVRGAHPTDRRARIVRLTPKGTAEIGRAFTQHEAAMNAAAEGLNNAERATLRQLLKKLGQTADDRLTPDEGSP